MRRDIELPVEGLDDSQGPDRQRRATTRIGTNVSEVDPVDLAQGCIAQRGGQEKHTSMALVPGTKVSLLCDVAFDNPSHTYANLASNGCTVEWSSTGANRSEAKNIVHDAFGNHYYVDGAAAVVKVNPSGRKVWNLPLPVKEKNAVVRALAVDVDGRIYAGVSEGVEPAKAQLFCFEQVDEDKAPELLWALPGDGETGWLTEELHIDGATLQASQNNPTTRQSRMALYSGLGLNSPTLIREWPAPYPINGHHFSPIDGSIFTAHQPDAQRTMDPRSPETTGSREDWTILNLDNIALRGWSWISGHDVDGGGLGNVDYAAGDEAPSLIDKFGKGRDLVANGPDTGGTIRKGGIAGRDSVYFNGTSNSYVSAAPVTTDFQFRELNQSFLPCHSKAQFALFMVLRLPQEATARTILDQSDTLDRVLTQNGGIRGAGGPQAALSSISCFESTTGTGASGPTWGGNVTPLAGCFDNSGLVLITWIHDGGYDDVVSVPTRSTFRVNGRPCDRWQSLSTGFANLKPTYLGKSVESAAAFVAEARLRGDLLEAVVLSDWYLPGFADTSPLVQQRLLTTPIYPDAVWSADGDTELERIEGWLAHLCGMAHKLPSGQQNCIRESGVPADGDTVTIGATVYTLKTALTPTANQVLIGGSGLAALTNLHHAINGSGTAGVDYAATTVRNPDVFAAGVPLTSNTSGNALLIVQRRDPRIFATFVTTDTSANLTWVNGATSVSSANGSGLNSGAYPHSFYLQAAYGTTGTGTPISRGGPPRSNGVTFPSVIGALISPYGMLVKWDPANGKARNVLTTNGPGYTFLPVGGVGYGVRIASDGSVFSIGPRQAVVSGIIASADNIDVRKLWDKGAEDTTSGGWATSNGSTATSNWEANPGAQTYAYPRMDVDKWDNVYVPLYQASNGSTLAAYAKLGASGGSLNADVLLLLQSLTDDPRAYAVSIDPEYPIFPNAYTKPRAERVLIGTERVTSASNFTVLHMVRIVSATLSNLPSVDRREFAACGANLFDITNPAIPALVSATAFNASTRLISWCEAFGKLFFTDGDSAKFYDPYTSLLGAWRAQSAGEIPKRFQFIEKCANRIFVGGLKDFPEHIVACTSGDPFGWDLDPPGEAPLATAAYRSDLSPMGDYPDFVTGFCSARNDLLYVCGARSLSLIRGDPLQGGRFDTVVKGVGVAYGRAACVTPDGRLWWVSQEAELWSMPVGGDERSAVRVSDAISKRLQDAIDFAVCRPELIYDPRLDRINLLLLPLGAGDTLFRHFVVSLRGPRPRFWEESYGATGIQPTAARVFDGNSPSDRKLRFGSRDGYVRNWSATAASDDGTRIASECFLGPLHDQAQAVEAMVSNVEILLARAQGGARVELYATDEPDDLGDAVASASLLPGRNTPAELRQTGAYLGLLITGETGLERFSVRRVSADLVATGPVRSRGR